MFPLAIFRFVAILEVIVAQLRTLLMTWVTETLSCFPVQVFLNLSPHCGCLSVWSHPIPAWFLLLLPPRFSVLIVTFLCQRSSPKPRSQVIEQYWGWWDWKVRDERGGWRALGSGGHEEPEKKKKGSGDGSRGLRQFNTRRSSLKEQSCESNDSLMESRVRPNKAHY